MNKNTRRENGEEELTLLPYLCPICHKPKLGKAKNLNPMKSIIL